MSLTERIPLWRTTLQIVLWRHGWAWPLAVAGAVLAFVIHFFVFEANSMALATAQADLAQGSATALRLTTAAPTETEQQQVQTLQTVLRQSPEADELVRKMAALAQAEQIALPQSDYQQQYHGATQVIQVRVTQPVHASYSQLRRYIESVLRGIPNASLDQIAARRDNVGQSQLEARLRWSFWIQAPSTPLSAKNSSGESTP